MDVPSLPTGLPIGSFRYPAYCDLMQIQRNTNKVRHLLIHTIRISSSLAVHHLVHEHLITAPKYPTSRIPISLPASLPYYPDPPSLILHVAYLETTACSSQRSSGTLADHVLSSHVNQPDAVNIHGHSLASLFLCHWQSVVLQCPLDPKNSSGSQDGPGLAACAPSLTSFPPLSSHVVSAKGLAPRHQRLIMRSTFGIPRQW